MKITAFTTTLIILMCTITSHAQNLKDFRWKNRILILANSSLESTTSKSAFDQVFKQIDAWKERDVIVLFLRDRILLTPAGKEITYEADLPKGFNGYLLIGKDGGIKMREKYPLDTEKVFRRIDSMPMRRAEMKEND